jgi:hypothetical protein
MVTSHATVYMGVHGDSQVAVSCDDMVTVSRGGTSTGVITHNCACRQSRGQAASA